MNKKLIKIYILMFISYFAFSMLFPNVLPESYKVFNTYYLKAKIKITSEEVTTLPSVTKGKINVMFVMDDGWKSEYTIGYNLFKQYGMKANIAAIPSLVGKDGYMTLNQLSDLYINGWDILSHTYNHYSVIDLSSDEKISEFNKTRSWLLSHGFVRTKDIVVFPGGYYDQNTIDVLKTNNYKSARSLKEVWNIPSEIKESDVNIIILDSSFKADWAIHSIDNALINNKDIIFILHKLEKVTTNTGMQYDPQSLEQILDYVSSKKEKINVVTYSQWLNIKN